MTTETLGTTFLTAVLLSGSSRRAEAAMLDGIESDSDNLLRETVVSALERSNGATEPSPLLPPELQRVLRLPAHLRRPFVLRILMAYPAARCAELLHSNAETVDLSSCQAMKELARMARAEGCALPPLGDSDSLLFRDAS